MNVLVVAPHPDDESIGCGGTICIHAGRGDRVAVIFLTSGEFGLQNLPVEEARRVRERESEDAARILGISSATFLRRRDHGLEEEIEEAAQALKPILERECPEIVYLTHERDFHPDHRASVSIVQTALRISGIPSPALLSYEVLTPVAEYDRVEDISPVMERKLRAVRAHRSQVRQFQYDRAVRALNRFRGVVAGAGRYAEAFRCTDSCMGDVSLARRADPAWYRIHEAAQEIRNLVPADGSFILVDEGRFEAPSLFAPRRPIPFLEKNGAYWGKPPDDATAIGELERLREAGAGFIVFPAYAFWWLDCYTELNQYLRTKFRCIRQNARIIAFDLKARSTDTWSSPVMTEIDVPGRGEKVAPEYAIR
ncbi:MAG TPA: PIG-L deacetylase family protein [Bryobacteraceae bacterium]|nr:PIG-L deacetylase family protein [Bryobacteraceae bacterium]